MDTTIPQETPQDKPTPKKIVYIYALCDPSDQSIRYVGKTDNLQKRMQAHLRDKGNTHKARWIRKVQSEGFEPQMKILEETTQEIWAEREIFWIQEMRNQGHLLTNTAEGGLGGGSRIGAILSDETRAKIGTANKGKMRSPEARAKMSASQLAREQKATISEETRRRSADARRGKELPPEVKAKIATANLGNTHAKGLKHSTETRAKVAAALRGKKHSPEAIAKTAAARRGQKHTDEAKAKISAARKGKPGHPSTPEINAKISAAHKGRKREPLSEEQKRKISEVSRGRKQSPEHIAKRADARRGKKMKPEAGANISLGKKRAKAMRNNPSEQPTLWD